MARAFRDVPGIYDRVIRMLIRLMTSGPLHTPQVPMLAPSLGRCALTTQFPYTARVVLSLRARLPPPPLRVYKPRRTRRVTSSVGGDLEGDRFDRSASPLIKRRREQGNTMERVRVWAGFPSTDAVESLSVICAHCNAKLTPGQMDYKCDESKLVPELKEKFKPLTRDAATNAFLMRSSNRPYLVNWTQAAACTFLRKFMSLTDANAMLGRGKMHVLSEEQVRDLLRNEETKKDSSSATKRILLDVGAGEGEVTMKFKEGGQFDNIVATEASSPMVKRLRQKNIDVVVESYDVETVIEESVKAGVEFEGTDSFDTICLLNVLDRCDTPFTLLGQLRKLLKDKDGKLVIAVVVPFRPFVEDGNNHRAPKEKLGLDPNGPWELGVNAIWKNVLKPSGFIVDRLARVPYISEGDQKHGAYILDDAVFVLSKAE